MIISGGYIECFASITNTNYYEHQTHRWDLGNSTGSIDPAGSIHLIPYTWTVTGGGRNSYQSWNIYGTSQHSITQLYFQAFRANNTNPITLSHYSGQFEDDHAVTGAGIDASAWELNYVPSELQWSAMYAAPSFVGGQWLVLKLPTFSKFGRSFGGLTISLPWTPGATETTNMEPFYGAGAGSPSSRMYTARWYWEIDF
jgi:hypothetical protein